MTRPRSFATRHYSCVLRFLGYHDRRPYLRLIDAEKRTVDAIGITRIPQGIDELVPLDGVLAVRCGPTWMGLATNLAGELRPLTPAEVVEASNKSAQLNLLAWNHGKGDREWTLPVGGVDLQLPQGDVHRWGYTASVSPDGNTIAVGACLTPEPEVPPSWEAPYEPEVWSLVLVDVATGSATRCEGHFEGFPFPPTWTADSSVVVVGAPFDPKHLHVARRSAAALEAVSFRRQIAMPLLDASFVSL